MAADPGRIRHRPRQVDEAFGCQAHQGVVAHAVVAALEFQDQFALAVGACQAHGVHIGFGAGRNEAYLLRRRQGRDDILGECDAAAVIGEKSRAKGQLSVDRGAHLRVAMADKHGSRAKQEVDIFIAVDIPYPAAFTTFQNHFGRKIAKAAARQHRRGAGVPLSGGGGMRMLGHGMTFLTEARRLSLGNSAGAGRGKAAAPFGTQEKSRRRIPSGH